MLTEEDVAALNDQACTNNFGRQGEWDELNEDGKAWALELANLAYSRGKAEAPERVPTGEVTLDQSEAARQFLHQDITWDTARGASNQRLLEALLATREAAAYSRGKAEAPGRGVGCPSCRACGKELTPECAWVADGCPCNSPRGVNHGLVPRRTCACAECDPDQTGSTRNEATQNAQEFLARTETRHQAQVASLPQPEAQRDATEGATGGLERALTGAVPSHVWVIFRDDKPVGVSEKSPTLVADYAVSAHRYVPAPPPAAAKGGR
jgi:hypothetical protein